MTWRMTQRRRRTLTRQPSKNRIPCPLCGRTDNVVKKGESWHCQRCKVHFNENVSGNLRVGLARAIYTGYDRGPRSSLRASLPDDILEEFDELVGKENVGSGKHRSAVLALALELLLAVLSGKNTQRLVQNLDTLSVDPRETRMNLMALVEHLDSMIRMKGERRNGALTTMW